MNKPTMSLSQRSYDTLFSVALAELAQACRKRGLAVPRVVQERLDRGRPATKSTRASATPRG